jgi:hypothetical protein
MLGRPCKIARRCCATEHAWKRKKYPRLTSAPCAKKYLAERNETDDSTLLLMSGRELIAPLRESLTPYQRNPCHWLGKLQADLPFVRSSLAAPNAKQLRHIALEYCTTLGSLLLQLLCGITGLAFEVFC